MTAPSNERPGGPDGDVMRAPALTAGAFWRELKPRWRRVLLWPFLAAVVAYGATYLIAPVYTARSSFLPPQQGQSSAATALASLGTLSGLAGAAAGISTPGDRYVALMQSTTVTDRMIDQFDLMKVYDVEFRVDARRELARNVRIAFGKKDGLIAVEVDDEQPQRAADMANRYVEELRRIAGSFALTEAQQRRVFFEQHLQTAKANLERAQRDLQQSGFGASSLRAEPKATAETYSRLKAETTAAETRLNVLRSSLAEETPEIRQQRTLVLALRARLDEYERSAQFGEGAGYVGKYREFKYQETLFELYARQFELARMDESRDGLLIQPLDVAQAPEKRTRPRRTMTALGVWLAVSVAMIGWVAWLGARAAGNNPSPAWGR